VEGYGACVCMKRRCAVVCSKMVVQGRREEQEAGVQMWHEAVGWVGQVCCAQAVAVRREGHAKRVVVQWPGMQAGNRKKVWQAGA